MLKKHTFSLHAPIRVKIRSVTEPKEHFYKIHLKFKEKSLIIDLAQNWGLQLKITQGRHSGYSVAKSCIWLFMTPWSMPAFPVPYHLSGFSQVHVHWISVAIQPSHPLLPSSPSTDIVTICHSVALLSPNSRPKCRTFPSWGAWLYLE